MSVRPQDGCWVPSDSLRPAQSNSIKRRAEVDVMRSASYSKKKEHYSAAYLVLARLQVRLPSLLQLPLWSLIGLALMLAVVLPVYFTFNREGVRAAQSQRNMCVTADVGADEPQPYGSDEQCQKYTDSTFNYDPTESTLWTGEYPDAFGVEIIVTDVVISQREATLKFRFWPYGPTYDLHGTQTYVTLPQANTTLKLQLQYDQVVELRPGDLCSDLTMEHVFITTSVDVIKYPFDEHRIDLAIDASIVDDATGNATWLPVVTRIRTDSPSFSLLLGSGDAATSDAKVEPGMTRFLPSVLIQRTATTRFFAVFVVVLMWLLSISTFVLAVDLVYVRRVPVFWDSPTFAATLLFALPAIRQVQPDVPDIGAAVDVIGFFWNMALVSISCLMLLAAMFSTGRPQQDDAGEEGHRDGSGAAVAPSVRATVAVLPAGAAAEEP